MSDQKPEGYKARLKKARQKRNGKDPMKYFMIAAACLIVLLITVMAVKLVQGGRLALSDKVKASELAAAGGEDATASDPDAALRGRAAAGETDPSPSRSDGDQKTDAKTDAAADKKKAVVDSYKNLGIVEVSGYLNMRTTPSKDGEVIGKLLGGSACEVLGPAEGGWYQVSSGGLTGYISSEFVLTGDKAKEKALDLVDKMAVIKTAKLNVRSEPNQDAQVLEQVLKNERYQIKSDKDGWIEISSGYISSDYVDVRYALNEARKLDLRTMVFNMYDNLGISNVNNYLNIREEPKESAKIVGKMTSKSAGDILETTKDGQWYKISSGPVTGYVKSEFILTGEAAKAEALKVAQLMAIVNTDRLNARTEPNTNSPIWTQISNSERYTVLKQLDGWVQIELDTTNAYVATDYVDVRYALNEAIKFTPIEEPKPGSTGNKGNSNKGNSNKGNSNKGNGGVGNTPGSAPASSKRTQIANYATQFLGNPYVWGGTSLTNGADCSGFTMSVMAKFGVSLPHHSGSQANSGKSISSSQMRPGDLIFYTNSGGTINHVALYIGNGQVVHASNKRDGIKISTWNYRTPAKIVNVLGD